MRYPTRRGGYFAPAIHQKPANESTRARVVAGITQQRAEEQNNILGKRVELILQGPTGPKQIPPQLAVDFQDKARFRLVVRVIRRQKICKQLSIFVDRINW